ncbi:mediator of RNA polymerase II transcription subunit 23 [Trichonephila clavipes]|nr:mediator of RNA polymerase II transcription subunit 23 [Trichonephila clavipes]
MKALKFYKELKESEPSTSSRESEVASADEEAARKYPEKLAKIIKDGEYCAHQVFNADETGLFWKKMPTRTYIAKSEKTASGFKAAKDRVTLLLWEGFDDFGEHDIEELLVDEALNDDDILESMVDITKDLETVDSEPEEDVTPLDEKLLKLSAHLRTFADFLVYEFAISPAGQHVNKYVDALNDLIWKCHVIQLDRLILCLSLRSFEGDEAQVCFLIIRMLLLKSQEFKNRVYDFVKYNSPEHWKQSDWHEKHLMFHRVYQEKFYFEGLRDFNAQHTYIPIYFGNVCLRFLPVMDIVIHRFLELPTVTLSFECLLDTLGCLYKFHDRPLTYLYNTLHYYEQRLRDRPPLKKKLVSAIIGSLKDVRPEGWALSEGYIAYTQDTSEELNWIPDHDYYVKLIGRLVDTLGGKSPFPHTDWRFNEFPNQGAHALHVTCIELMALPVSTTIVGNAILDVVLKGRTVTVHSNIVAWMNAVGLVLTALPEAYWSVLNDRILDVMQSPLLSNPLPEMDPFLMFDFVGSYNSMTELPCSYVVALTHAVWYHASIGQICTLTQLLKLKFKPAVKNEVQFIFICHLVAPFLQRFYLERTRYAMEITVELYEMLEAVDKNCEQLLYIDAVCDLLYHIKYMFIGDAIKNEIEKSIRNLRPAIQRKLRFITHLNIEEGTTT